MADYRAEVAEEMIRQIEAGTAPWQKPWQPGVIRARPFNPASGKDYRGINSWWLEMQGHGDPRWLTYRQATALDAQVRKGERGTTVEYWQWTRQVPEVDADGNEVLDDDGKPKLQTVRLDRPRVFFARVFNAEQIDGLAPLVTPAPAFEPVARAEEILAAGGVSITHDQSDRAFYRPATDRIHLPAKAAFAEAYEYYATALHELGHATGHPSRLARTFGPFGSRDYAVEELRAEMASFLLTTESGLGHYPERHAGYVESWLKVLKDDRNLLFRAARDAETIRAWVLEPERRQALERGAAMENEAAAVPTVEPALAPVAAAAAPAVAADAVALPTLDGDATVTLERGMLRLNRHGGSMTFGGTAVAVRWAVQNQVPDADLTAVLRMVGAVKPLPTPDMIPAAEGKAVAFAGPGDFAGRIVDVGDRHILQETPKGLVLHDMAALGYDGASMAALVAAQEAGTTVRLTYDNDGSLGLDVTATMEAARQAGTAFDAARDFAPAPTVSLPTLDGDATVTLERGMLRLNRHGGSMSFGGTAVAVRWAVQNQVPDADLTAVLRMVGAAKPLPAPDMIPAAEGKAVALAGPGDFAGRIVDVGDRHILQETPKGLVLHDMAAMDFDAAAVAGLVRAQEVGSAVTFGYGPDGGLRSLDSEHHPELQAWRKQGMENGEAAERHYLQVPYPERHAAKAAGARWDKEAKAWYVPEGVDPAAFAKWEKGAATAERQAPETAAERTAAPEKAERVYLAVPYAERNAAKAAGARWDRHRKAWYVGADADPAAVARWQAKEPAVTTAPAVDPVKEFADALKAHGLVVEGAPVMDGRWHRAAVDGDRKGVQSGSYRGFLDGVPNGQIMNYKAGKEAVKWVATGATVDPTERAQMQAQAAARAVLREAERAAAAERGAQVARGLLRTGKPFEAGTEHPYLQRKGIVPMSRLSLKDDTLLVPMVNVGGAVRNVQSIAADGEKRYVAGAEKVGLYHPIDPDR
ncbi:zincin-like metallopeptidase domain-containing protein, partial [Caenispirillum bisanense]|uniref:zincin-like metallopeptidase domain-containing protein n=1 Tax=Caenispirillum bisanense TaxID=414052 RepID=UPI0031E30AEC